MTRIEILVNARRGEIINSDAFKRIQNIINDREVEGILLETLVKLYEVGLIDGQRLNASNI